MSGDSKIKADKSQVGVIGNNIRIEGGIHIHQTPPPDNIADSEKPAEKIVSVKDDAVKVFISYARENCEIALKLYSDLKKAGVSPWIDEEDLLPGQNWKLTITKEIKKSRFFIAVLSSSSVAKKGFVQTELKKALDILDTFPHEDIFIIPVRIDKCDLPERLADINYTDIFPSYEKGLQKILKVLRKTTEQVEKEQPEKIISSSAKR